MIIGETVRMTEGPFLGMEGTVVGSLGQRVILAVILRSRRVQIEIDCDWTIEATPRRRPAARSAVSKPNWRRAK
jgi:hypothetical protein